MGPGRGIDVAGALLDKVMAQYVVRQPDHDERSTTGGGTHAEQVCARAASFNGDARRQLADGHRDGAWR
jgi:hypothetical protein